MPGPESKNGRWRRTESRQVRPFKYVEGYLNDAQLRLSLDGDFSSEEFVPTDEVDFNKLAPAIRVPVPPEHFAKFVGISPSDLALTVIIEDAFFKTTTEVCRIPLSEVCDKPIELASLPECLRHGAAPVRIHAAVTLTRVLEPTPGRAWRLGSWLSRKTFTLRRSPNIAIFPIETAPAEQFMKWGLPEDAAYYVNISDGNIDEPPAEFPSLVSVHLNESVFAAMSDNADSSASRALMSAMYVDIVTSVLTHGFAELDSDPRPDGILELVVSRLNQDTGVPRSEIVSLATNQARGKLAAIVQSHANLSHEMIAATRRRA